MLGYDKSLIEKYQQQYLEKIRMYAKFPAAKMNLATVYIVNSLTTKLENVDNVVKRIGDNSPVRFTKIINYPLFSLTERSGDISFEFDVGFKTSETTTTCRVMPLKYQIGMGDLIILNGIDKEIVYEAKDGFLKQDTQDKNMQITELTLKVKNATIEDIEAQTTDIYEYIFDQDLFIKQDELSKVNILLGLLQEFWSLSCKPSFVEYKGFVEADKISFNKLFQDCIVNGKEKLSSGFVLTIAENGNLANEYEVLDIDIKNTAISELVTAFTEILADASFFTFVSLLKILSDYIKVKLNQSNNLEILK